LPLKIKNKVKLPKKTTQLIIDSGNEYVIQIKRNQSKLYQVVKNMIHSHSANKLYHTREKSRGRQEYRKIAVFAKPSGLSEEWKGVARVLHVERKRTHQKETEISHSYYITSLQCDDAELLARGVRGHWSIENQLHWVKDTIMHEDDSYIRRNNGIENLSILKNIAINLVKKTHGNSVKKAAIHYAANVKELYQYFRT